MIYWLHLTAPVVGLLINVIGQLCGCRYLGLLRSVYVGFLIGVMGMMAIEIPFVFTTRPELKTLVGQIALNTITYGALGYCYFHFINLGETARRIRIIREIWESENGLSMGELRERYNASDIIRVRLQRMIRNRQIILRGDRYYIGKPILLYVAKIIGFMKLILLKRETEFE
jgi:hypothetical protein